MDAKKTKLNAVTKLWNASKQIKMKMNPLHCYLQFTQFVLHVTYLHYKTVTCQNVAFEAQVNNFLCHTIVISHSSDI